MSRADNDSLVNAYAFELLRVFDDWLRGPQVVASLESALQAQAVAHFEGAYLRGKRQALQRVGLAAEDRARIRQFEESNDHYLHWSLGQSMERRATLARILGEDVEGRLDSGFRSRIRIQYGGRLWQVQEAGYLAGVKVTAQLLRLRLRRAPLLQSVGKPSLAPVEDEPEDEADRVSDSDLAWALGLTLSGLAGWVSHFGRSPTAQVRTGVEYATEEDKDVCDPCDGNAAGGEGGIYWLPDEPPLPGSNCQGSQACRCHLATVVETS